MVSSKQFSPEFYDKAPSPIEKFSRNEHLHDLARTKKILGRRLRTCRLEQKITVTLLAKRLEVDPGEVFRAESGDPLIELDFLMFALLTLGETPGTIGQLFLKPPEETDNSLSPPETDP